MQDHVVSSTGAMPKQYGKEGGGNRGAKLARRSKQQEGETSRCQVD